MSTHAKKTRARNRTPQPSRSTLGAYKVAVAATASFALLIAILLSFSALSASRNRHARYAQTREASVRTPQVPLPPAVYREGRLELNADLEMGEPCVVENVTAWPVYPRKAPEPVGDYLTLAQAQQQQTAEIREVGADTAGGQAGGQVNQLVIENKGALPILVLAGTLVQGGKQDRQIAQDFILPAHATTPVDAFCVEHGRWTSNREGVQTEGQFTAESALASKGVRGKAQFKASRRKSGMMWRRRTRSRARAPAPAPTSRR